MDSTKTKSYLLEKFDNGMHYIKLDTETVKSFLNKDNNRLKCKISDIEFHCAIISKKEGGYFVYIGSTLCKKLKIKAGDKVEATFKKDDTKYQFNMPVEFEEVLATDPDANKVFHSLTEGNQRGLIYLVNQVKSIDKRIERALKISEKIKIGITSPKLVLKK